MRSMLTPKDWKRAPPRSALSPAQIVGGLARLDAWSLTGSGEQVFIEKNYRFANYFETLAFVNAVAWTAHVADHHPEMLVQYNRCLVRFNTHDVKGISQSDLDGAARIDALLVPHE